MKRILLIIALVLIVAIAIVLFNQGKTIADSKKLKVVTTLFPLYDFAKNIAGDKADIKLLLPPGIESHAFEPKPNDIMEVNNSDIFVFTGKYMEPWALDIIDGVSTKKFMVVDASDNINLQPSVFLDPHAPGAIDPHIWLDFDNAKTMVDNITQAFVEKDAANASFYLKNADNYKQKLSELDNDYHQSLTNCGTRELIYAGHYAFGYLAKRYGLIYLAAQGVSPDSEPTPQDMVRLVEQIKANNIHYVFYEELSSPKIGETLAAETNAKLLLLNAAHNLSKDDFEKGVSFIAIMQNNLKNLKIGLECK